jgi:ABC-type lipoprotein release transport system permease subunit
MVWSIAWRNVWRNKLRSLVVVLATAIGLYGSVYLIALMNGMMQQKIDATIENEISHIQLHHPKFLEDESVRFAIAEPDKIAAMLDGNAAVAAWCARVKATGMASTAHSGNGVMINGIFPEQEKTVTSIREKLTAGSYFEEESRIASIVISEKLAEDLKAEPGKKVVLTTAALSGETAQALFKVEGLYKTSNSMFDELNVFVRAGELQKMVAPDSNIVSEFAIRVDDDADTTAVVTPLRSAFPENELKVSTWKDLSPSLLAMMAMMDQFSYVMIIIVLLALAFIIVNVMLMVIIERTRELGMLMAIGMKRKRIFVMIMLETVFMSVTGALLGVILSVATIWLTGRSGINFAGWAEGLESVGYSAHVYPVIETGFYVFLGIMVILAAMLASVWPARKALKLQPAEAVRDET